MSFARTSCILVALIVPARYRIMLVSAVKSRLRRMLLAWRNPPLVKSVSRNGTAYVSATRLAGNLTEDDVIAREGCHHQRRAFLGGAQIRKRKWSDDHIAGYKCAHAASSSGRSQSRRSMASDANIVARESVSASVRRSARSRSSKYETKS